jgi:ribosome biogenesis GTPase
MGNKDWYTERWKNKQALKKKTRRLEKLKRNVKKDNSDEDSLELTIYDSDDPVLGELNQGILAGLSYPTYTILSKGKFIQGMTESKEQGGILSKLSIGDNIVFDMYDEKPVIMGITQRRSKLVRLRADASRRSQAGAEEQVIAVNMDLAIIVASVAQPTFHPRLVDRYLIVCQYGNIRPLLCLTKIDLAPIPDVSMYRGIDLPVVSISNKTNEGIDQLLPYLNGKCCVLVGNSGVGKSSLVNTLLKREEALTGEVSKKSGKGRHTTSAYMLHVLDKSTYLIDTPGIRSLGLLDIDKRSLRLYFPEFHEFATNCKFNDCTHYHEPDCAVKKAVEEGFISQERYDSYIRILSKS